MTVMTEGSDDKSDDVVAGTAKGRGRRGGAGAVDAHVGARVRLQRTLRGMSQEKLGEALGLTFQQVQKYERGSNRIGAGRLHEIATVLDVPVEFFYEGVGANGPLTAGLAEEPAKSEFQVMNRRETLELVRAYYRIGDPKVRRRIVDLIKSVVASGPEDG